VIHDWG